MKHVVLAACLGVSLLWPAAAGAHCDSMDGPVVKAAQRALDSRNLSHALIWLQAADETEARAAFDRALAIRDLNGDARAVADRYFFETIVRLHRAGEGAPYTGLKPAGAVHPAIAAADQAMAQGSPAPLTALLVPAMQAGLRRQLDEVMHTAKFPSGDVEAGRRFVKAYVEFVHYVERLHEAIAAAPHGHFPEPTNRDPR